MLFICFFIVLSCERAAPEPDTSLIGRWMMSEAIRNGRPTLTLEDAYFHFENDSMMRFNLLRSDEQVSYSYIDGVIRHEDPTPMEYQVLSLTDDTLQMTTQIRAYQFEFTLVRDTSGVQIDL